MGKVTVSDGTTGEVRRLRFLELEDEVPYTVDPPYVHTYESMMGVQEVTYVLSDWPEPPEKPGIPLENVQPDTVEYAEWQVYLLYQAVLAHEQKRTEQIREYLVNVSRYIRKECIDANFRKHVITTGDFDLVQLEAICPEVSKGDLEAELASTFQGILAWYADLRGVREIAGIKWDDLLKYPSVGNPATS